MFYLLDIHEKVGVEVQKMGSDIKESLKEKLEEIHIKENNGVFLGVEEIKKVSEEGDILPEEPYIFFDVEYTALFFQPLQNEIVEGIVSDVAEFGPFVKIGPIDALVHISQITKEKMVYNPKQDVITNKNGKLVIQKNDIVRAMVVSSSISQERVKVSLSMKGEGLGPLKWIKKK
ncbi:MAG: DNA-directed RNA polymerase [Candidatus Aenigmarchaeota archaeon ex4484_56]|nr:MAG: DNA-directed RNA polymerase [Candidatus Aenigmarchaeota archaeon ex4484_56]